MVVMDIIMILIPVTKHDWSQRVDVLSLIISLRGFHIKLMKV